MENKEDLKVGYNSHRLVEGDEYFKKEVNFVKVINQELQWNPRFLAQIINGNDKYYQLSEEGEKIALSIIQWLGTPVGQAFLERVNKKNGE